MDKGAKEGFSHWNLELRFLGRLVPSSKCPLEPLQEHRAQGAWDTHLGRKGRFLGNGSALPNSCVFALKGALSRILRKDRGHRLFPAPWLRQGL